MGKVSFNMSMSPVRTMRWIVSLGGTLAVTPKFQSQAQK